MALIEFKNLPDRTTAINANNLNFNFSEVLNLIYPIGRGFIDFTDTDYSNYLGFTWERELVGMTAVGLDTSQTEFNEVGKTGGEKTHKLTVAEMPSHSHGIMNCCPINGLAKEWNGKNYYPRSADSSYNNQVQINSSGGNGSHNNLQPYKVVSYWKRTA